MLHGYNRAIIDASILGFQLNTDVLSILILRYMRKDGTLRFGDFVSAILHLSDAFGTSGNFLLICIIHLHYYNCIICLFLFSSRHIREQGSSAKRDDKVEFIGGIRIFHFEDTMILISRLISGSILNRRISLCSG
jgi:hypothetical protein